MCVCAQVSLELPSAVLHDHFEEFTLRFPSRERAAQAFLK